MSATESIVILQHDADVPPGKLLTYLPCATVVHLEDHPQWVSDLLERYYRWDEQGRLETCPLPDGLVVLGGQDHAYSVAKPWYEPLRQILRIYHDEDRPCLGICLGAQMMAVAGSGAVRVAAEDGPENGVTTVSWNDEGIRLLPRQAKRAYEAHYDAIVELPKGAYELAHSSRYVQAFLWGSCLGVQFHPEVTYSIALEWEQQHSHTDTEALLSEFLGCEKELEESCELLCRWLRKHISQRS